VSETGQLSPTIELISGGFAQKPLCKLVDRAFPMLPIFCRSADVGGYKQQTHTHAKLTYVATRKKEKARTEKCLNLNLLGCGIVELFLSIYDGSLRTLSLHFNDLHLSNLVVQISRQRRDL
jgi:hypothetical protein